jgi:outer membrane protein TolC
MSRRSNIGEIGIFIVLFILTFVFGVSVSHAQDSSPQTLSLKQLFEIIKTYHPIVKQTDIQIEKTLAQVTMARGGFDPLLDAQIGNKSLNGISYYQSNSVDLRMPTWYGIEVATGLEQLNGDRLNPSETSGTLRYMGIEIPLLKNLWFDKRRASLQIAKQINTQSYIEQEAILNNLLMDAVVSYWEWVKYHQLLQVINNTLENNNRRFQFTIQSFQNGERAAIDTLDAFAQLQAIQLKQLEYKQNLVNASISLSNFLWNESGSPYLLPENIVPNPIWEMETSFLTQPNSVQNFLNLVETHPLLRSYQQKLDMLKTERRLKFQELLPKLNVKYNILQKSGTDWTGLPFQNNSQYGVKLALPLRFSEGRGGYQLAKLKIQETEWQQALKKQELQWKVESYFNDYRYLQEQLRIQENNYSNFTKLVLAEEQRLELGEGSLFLINVRENKALETLEKLLDLKTKNQKTICSLSWSAGVLMK